MEVEVFTIGGGEFIVNTFNAVAAWTGGGGYKSMIRVVMIMGFTYSLLVVAFNLDWRAWMNWFLQATLIYMCLMVPTTTVKVTDRINPSLAPAVVGNVPLGLGIIASFTSQIGDYLTRTAETVFVMPSSLNYSSNGIIYGSRLMEATRQIQIRDPEFAANLNEHMKQCVFYDIMLGFKSMGRIANAPNIWAAIGPGSPARSQKFMTADSSTGKVSTTIQTCNESYRALDGQWPTLVENLTPLFGKTLYPKLSNAVAGAKLASDLPATYQEFTGNASNAVAILQQHLSINAFMQARDGMNGGTAAASIDSFAATRADIQTRNTYSAIAEGAMKWVPVLNIVLTVVFYAMFPVLFPLFLLPKTGVPTLKGYSAGFFYLAAWGPLYVVLHMILMSKATAAGMATAAGGITLASYAGIGAVNNETATLAGYLISAVPFLAAGMAKGAMAISSQATSYLGPSQNAAEAAGAEATTGNYAYGNASLANATVGTRQMNQWAMASTYMNGAGSFSTRADNGAVETGYGSGNTVTNTAGAISQLGTKPSLSSGAASEAREMIGQFQSQSNQQREMASESTNAANTLGNQIFSTLQTSRGRDTVTGRTETAALSESQSLVSTWSNTLQKQYGLNKSSADEAARNAFVQGQFDISAGISAFGTGAKIAGTGATSSSTGQKFTTSADERVQQAADYLNSESRSSQASQTRDSFFRASATSSDSSVQGLTGRRDANITEARGYSIEAGRLAEAGDRYDKSFSESKTEGYQWSSDLSQDYAEFVARELATKQSLRDSGYALGMVGDLSPVQQAAKNTLERRYEKSVLEEMRSELGSVAPLRGSSIPSPGSQSEAGVNSWGAQMMESAAAGGPSISVEGYERDGALETSVRERIDDSSRRSGATSERADTAGRQAREIGRGIEERVRDRNDASLAETMPVVGPLISSIRGSGNPSSFDSRPYAASLGIRVKPGTNLSRTDTRMTRAFDTLAEETRAMGLRPPTLTSARDSKHKPGSLHPKGRAIDTRANDLSHAQGQALEARLRNRLGPEFFVDYETFKGNRSNNHIHIEYDPKGARQK